MKILLKKFGDSLSSRIKGKEAFLNIEESINKLKDNEKIEIDFQGLSSFSPSWADEFLTPLLNKFGKDLMLYNINNLSVKATLDLLEDINGQKFNVQS